MTIYVKNCKLKILLELTILVIFFTDNLIQTCNVTDDLYYITYLQKKSGTFLIQNRNNFFCKTNVPFSAQRIVSYFNKILNIYFLLLYSIKCNKIMNIKLYIIVFQKCICMIYRICMLYWVFQNNCEK